MTITDTDQAERSKADAVLKGLKCKCPKCGEGKLFVSWLKVTPQCSVCGEDLYRERAQDCPPYITYMIGSKL